MKAVKLCNLDKNVFDQFNEEKQCLVFMLKKVNVKK